MLGYHRFQVRKKPVASALAATFQRTLTFKPRQNVRITHSNVPVEHRHLFSEKFLVFLREVSGKSFAITS